MFILFIAFILTGLVWFAVVFMKEFGGGKMRPVASTAPAGTEPEEGQGADGQDRMTELKVQREAFEQRILKLEQMLEEKNQLIGEFQKNAYSEQEQQQQMEGLKQIFQKQIDELKEQNKELKREITRILQENMDLQAVAFAGQGRQAPAPSDIRPPEPVAPVVPPEEVVDVRVSAPLAPPAPAQEKKAPGGTLSLHDIFNADHDQGQQKV